MDIERLKQLAGVNEFQGYSEYKIDENPSITAAALKKKKKNRVLSQGQKIGSNFGLVDHIWLQVMYLLGDVRNENKRNSRVCY